LPAFPAGGKGRKWKNEKMKKKRRKTRKNGNKSKGKQVKMIAAPVASSSLICYLMCALSTHNRSPSA